jgi:hypothetical protein
MAQIILDSNNNLIQGDFDNATLNNRTKLQTTTTNATTNVYIAPNGSSTSAGVSVANNSSLTNASKIVMATNGTTDTQIISGVNGSGSYLPLSFYTNNALAMQVATSGYVGIGTSSPNALLHVSEGNAKIRVGVTADSGYLDISRDGTSGASVYNAAQASPYGFHTFQTAGTERMRIDSNGTVCINTTAPPSSDNRFTITYSSATQSAASIKNTSTTFNGNMWSFINSSNASCGAITQSGTTTTAFTTSSDYRLKENIAPMTGALDTVAQLKPVTYTWKEDGSAGQGFIAHELQEIVPDCVVGEKDAVETYTDEEGNEQTRIKPQGVDTSFLVATLTAAIQEQQTIINELKTRIEALESK